MLWVNFHVNKRHLYFGLVISTTNDRLGSAPRMSEYIGNNHRIMAVRCNKDSRRKQRHFYLFDVNKYLFTFYKNIPSFSMISLHYLLTQRSWNIPQSSWVGTSNFTALYFHRLRKQFPHLRACRRPRFQTTCI